MNPVARPWRALLPAAPQTAPFDSPVREAVKDIAEAAHARHARQLIEIDRYGESLRRMRRAIDAAVDAGHKTGYTAGWWVGARWGVIAGTIGGALGAAAGMWGVPLLVQAVAGWFA